jgi:hypothetical protein
MEALLLACYQCERGSTTIGGTIAMMAWTSLEIWRLTYKVVSLAWVGETELQALRNKKMRIPLVICTFALCVS